jgi:hypothetical protein
MRRCGKRLQLITLFCLRVVHGVPIQSTDTEQTALYLVPLADSRSKMKVRSEMMLLMKIAMLEVTLI